MADKAVFAFDFIVENVRELRENENVDAVEFKLLDFPSISIALKARETCGEQRICSSRLETIQTRTCSQRRRDHVSNGRSTAKICKGKSVVFELDPQKLIQDLKEMPLKVQLQRLELREGATTDRLAITPDTAEEGVLDLSEMAVSMEALLASQKLHPCRYSSRNTVVMIPKGTRVCVKLRLVCIGGAALGVDCDTSSCEIVPENKESGADIKLDYPQQVDQRWLPNSTTESKPQSPRCSVADASRGSDHYQPKDLDEGRRSSNVEEFVDPTNTDDASGTKDPTGCTDACLVSNSHEDVYIPNSVCPPPLVYHSEQRKVSECTQQRLSCQKPIYGSPCSDEVWYRSIVETEGYTDWSVLASHDQTSNPITTQLPNKKKPVEAASYLECHPLNEEATLSRNLPLLSALMEELSCLNSARHPKEIPKKVSSCQTGDIPRKQSKGTGVQKEHNVKVAPSPGQVRSERFVRKCCVAVRPRAKVIPSNKSVLYPPDIKHKRVKEARSAPRKKARSREQEVKQNLNKRKEAKKKSSSTALSKTGSVGPTPQHSPSSTSQSPSSMSHNRSSIVIPRKMVRLKQTQTETTVDEEKDNQGIDTAREHSLPRDSPTRLQTMVHREMVRLNAATQTETTVNDNQVIDTASEHSVPLYSSMVRLNAATQTETMINEEKDNQVRDTVQEQLLETESKNVANEMWESEVLTDNGGVSTNHSSSNVSLSPQNNSLSSLLSSSEQQGNVQAKFSSSVHELQTEEKGNPSLSRNPVLSQTLPVQGSRMQVRQPQSFQKLSRQKFSSTGDVRVTLPESPLLHSTMKGSVVSLHETSLQANDTLRTGRTLGSQTFDSFLSTDMLAEKGILPGHCRDGIVFLATSQSSLASEAGGQEQCEKTEGTAGDQKELSEDVEEMAGEMIESSGESVETNYSDDFEDPDSLEVSSNSN